MEASIQVLGNVALAPYTTLQVGGAARWFCEVVSENEMVAADCWAKEKGVPLFVLGSGSNLLVSDAGFAGLVMRVSLQGVENAGDGAFRVAAGVEWDAFVRFAIERDAAGVECLAGIPGTVGGTPVQNVGAYGQEVSETIVGVRAWDRVTEEFVELDARDCGFGYRRSRFNAEDQGRFIVSRVDYQLRLGERAQIVYADLKREFAADAEPSLMEVYEAVRRIRSTKGMLLMEGDADCKSAGSFFKNPIVSRETFEGLAARLSLGPEKIPHWSAEDGVKLPAAWVMEQSGFHRGYTNGRVGLSTKHVLALINRGGASAAELMALRDLIVKQVETRLGIRLEQEPVQLG